MGLVSTGYLDRRIIEKTVRDAMLYVGSSSLNTNAGENLKAALLYSDVEIAHPHWARHSYTHPEIPRAIATTLFGNNDQSVTPYRELQIIAKAAPQLSTHRMLARANGNSDHYQARGYYELERAFAGRVAVRTWEELPKARYCLAKRVDQPARQTLHLDVYNKPIYRILCPKLKTDLMFDGLSGALALLLNHDPTKRIVDSLEISAPDCVVSDGIIAAVGPNRTTGRGHELGVILVANNAVAHDLVAAQIFNLDPNRIEVLQTAIRDGWGPTTVGEIEIGGAGLEGITGLSSKTRFWNFGLQTLAGFETRFQSEHPGFHCQIEKYVESESNITAHSESLVEKALVSWIYKTYDFPKTAMKIAFWPKSPVLTGAASVHEILSSSARSKIITIGTEASDAFEKAIAFTFWQFPLRGWFRLPYGISIRKVQLRNGHRLLWYSLPCSASELTNTNAFSWLFTIAHRGRMTAHLFRTSYLVDRISCLLRNLFSGTSNTQWPRVLTTRLPHNRWWTVPIRPKTSSAPSPEL